MHIAVVGTRTFHDYSYMDRILKSIVQPGDIIVTGDQKGTDTLAVLWAKNHGHEYIRHVAEWKRYDKAAGPIRNGKVVKDADEMVAFWDGKSPGTADAIEQAVRNGLKVKIYPISKKRRKKEHGTTNALSGSWIPIVVMDWFGIWRLGGYARSIKEVEILCGQAFQAGCGLLGVHYEIDKPVYFDSWASFLKYHMIFGRKDGKGQ